MRKLLVLVLAAGLLPGLAGRVSAADDDLRAVIDKAIKAQGGEEKLAKVKASQSKGTGSLEILGGLKFTIESSSQLPAQLKNVMQFEINGMNVTQTVVVNGDNAWINFNGMDIPIDEKISKAMKEEGRIYEVIQLLPLKKDKEYKLSSLGEMKVGGDDAIGIQVSRKDRGDVSLYFSKASGLLLKVDCRVTDFMAMQEVGQEMFFSDYKEGDGYKSPRKIVIHRDGKKFLEMELSEVKVLDKLDESVFAKP